MALQREFPKVEFVEFGPAFNQIRRVRSEEELPYLRRSGYLTDLACEALERELRPGMTEQDILSVVYGAYLKNGGEPGIHFIATTQMDDPDRFVPCQRPTPRTISVGSVVITELTVSFWGYSTQIHRPFAIGREPSAIYRKLFDVALECYENVRKICNPALPARKSSPLLRSSKRTASPLTTASFTAKPARAPSWERVPQRILWKNRRWRKTWCI